MALLVGAVRHVTTNDFTTCARCFQISVLVRTDKKDARLIELMDAKIPCTSHTEALLLSDKPPLT